MEANLSGSIYGRNFSLFMWFWWGFFEIISYEQCNKRNTSFEDDGDQLSYYSVQQFTYNQHISLSSKIQSPNIFKCSFVQLSGVNVLLSYQAAYAKHLSFNTELFLLNRKLLCIFWFVFPLCKIFLKHSKETFFK